MKAIVKWKKEKEDSFAPIVGKARSSLGHVGQRKSLAPSDITEQFFFLAKRSRLFLIVNHPKLEFGPLTIWIQIELYKKQVIT